MRDEEQEIIDLLQNAWGRALTEQEINLALEQAKALGELNIATEIATGPLSMGQDQGGHGAWLPWQKLSKIGLSVITAGVVGWALSDGPTAHAQDKTIKIGALFPMSGPGSYFGAQDKQGVELALEELNKAGVNGYKFVVQYEDSSCSPLPATQAAKRLIEQFKPDVIIGEECSDATLAVMPVVEQAKVPLLNAGSSSIKVTEPGNPWTFRIMPNEVMQGINLAENASKRMKAQTAVLLFENTNAGIGNAQVFKDNFTKLGGKVLAEIGFGRDVNDFTAIATRVAGLGSVDVIPT
jgi:branched-chain amino acid transport system substrate-binding protein